MAGGGLSFDDLDAALRGGTLASLYLFHGEETLLVDEAVQRVVDTAMGDADRAFNLDVLSGSENDARDIVSRASSFPMMSERRVVVVRDVERMDGKGLELLTHFVENPSPTTCLVLVAAKADMRKKPFTTIRKNGVVMEFKALYDNQLPAWIEKRVLRLGKTIAPEAGKLLAAYVGSSLRALDNEIDKLMLFIRDRTSISADDVAAVVGFTREFSVFELQKAVGAKNLPRAVEIMERMIDAGAGLPFVFTMLTSYYATLWKLADLRRRGVAERELAGEAGINPYFVREYLEALRQHGVGEIEQAFSHLAEADEQSKTGSRDPRQIMHLLLIRLIGYEPAPA
jgi:DNA polymerase-3 subunit delta